MCERDPFVCERDTLCVRERYPLCERERDSLCVRETSFVVQRLNVDFGSNRALFDKSMKLGKLLIYMITILLRTIGNLDLSPGAHGGHFSKWRLPISNNFLKTMIHRSGTGNI